MYVDKIFNLRWYDDDVWLCNAENLLFKYETNQMMFNYRCDAIQCDALSHCKRWQFCNLPNYKRKWIWRNEFVELDEGTCEHVHALPSLPLAYELLIITLLPYGNNHVFESIMSSFYGLKPISKAIDETFYCCRCHHFHPPKCNRCRVWKAKETLEWFAWKISYALMHKVNGYLHLEIGDFVVLIVFPLDSVYLSATTCYLIVRETWKFEELNWKLTSKSVKNQNRHIHTHSNGEKKYGKQIFFFCVASQTNWINLSFRYYSTENVRREKSCE